MFEKSDDKIRATRNLNRNKDMIDNQLKKSERYMIKEHFLDSSNFSSNPTLTQNKFKEELS